jgi:hypothetical protein
MAIGFCSRFVRWLPLGIAGLMLSVAGCNSSTAPPPKTPSGKTTTAAPASTAVVESACEGTLSSIDDIFKLSRLGRTTAIDDGVLRLNDWQRSCMPAGADTLAPLPDSVSKLLTEGQRTALVEKRFTTRDGEHLRDCLIARAIAGYGVGSARSELERVTELFRHAMRSVGLIAEPLQGLPLVPYDVCLLGKGTAEDRAWLFVDLLRQLRIDAVLIFPGRRAGSTREPAGSPPFLIGVLLERQVYLFDARAGVPIPSAAAAGSGDAGSARPATLDQVLADPSLLQQLDAGPEHPYPIKSVELQHPVVAIVGNSSLWSGKMQALQTQFVANRAMVISDPLQIGDDHHAGVWQRIVAAGGDLWNADDVRFWDYPETRLNAHGQMNRLELDSLDGLLLPFRAYLNVSIDARTGRPVLADREAIADRAADKDFHPGVHINVRMTKGEQMRARLAHLEGDFANAIQSYTDVRLKCLEVLKANPSPADRIMHTRAKDDAVFWTALCKFEQGEFKEAAALCQRYLKQTEAANWLRESRLLLARSLAESRDYPAAIVQLEGVPPDNPEYLGLRLLIHQWQAAEKRAQK